MEKQPSKLFYSFMFSLAMIFVGSTVVITKELTSQLPIFFTLEVRFLVAMLVFYLIVKIKGEVLPQLDNKDYIVLFVQSATGIFLYNVFLFYGLRYTSGIEAGIILSLTPIFAAIVAFILLKERVSHKRWGGIMLAVFGVVLINLNSFAGHGVIQYSFLRILGNIMIVGAALSEGIFGVTAKYNRAKLSAYQICLVVTTISFILFLPLSIYESLYIDYSLINLKLILQLAYFTIVNGIFSYILAFTAAKHISATTAGVLTVLIPISSIALSIIFLGDTMQLTFLAGSLVALVGVIIVTKFE